jgi:transposase InsO family protein
MFDDANIRSIEELQTFIEAAEVFGMKASCSAEERATWIRERLLRFRYRKLGKNEKGILRTYLCTVTGLKERALKYHITAYKRGRNVSASYERHCFPVTYTNEDRELLAETDNLHGRLNGHATREICKAMYAAGDKRFVRLQDISNGHLYNLRDSRIYREQALTIAKTKPVQVPIGKREKPQPNGQAGFIRVDTVHQGDQNGEKGVYHVNLVDEVVQWEIVVAVEEISESFLEDVLMAALDSFPFVIQNFHSDNGSEYINKTVAALLNKLLIRQTKSRSRHSTDNGLVETKNGAIIRKHMGYWHIPGKWAPRINVFYRDHLVPYRPHSQRRRLTPMAGRKSRTRST